MVNQIFLIKKDNDSLSNYVSVTSVPTRILVSGALAFFATIVGKKGLDIGVIGVCYLLRNGKFVVIKGDLWTVKSIQDNLEKQLLNADMIPNEKNDVIYQCYLTQF